MNSKKLILHIGAHKTGTTSIQGHLAKHKETLNKAGVDLFHQDPEGKLIKRGHINSWLAGTDNFEAEGSSIKPGLANALAATQHATVIASAENFSWASNASHLEKLRAELANIFSEITIVVYLRRQDRQAISHHQQGSKRNSFPSAKFFGREPKALPGYQPHFDNYLDYAKNIGQWADVFGDQNMVIRVMEKDQLLDGDVVADFVQTLKLPIPTTAERLNESMSGYQFKVNMLLSKIVKRPALYKHLTRRLAKGDKGLPSKKDAMSFYKHYAESNIALNKRFAISENPEIFDLNFDDYPTVSNIEWNEASANHVITELLTTVVNTSLKPEDIKTLTDAYDALASSKPQLAVKLLRMGLRQQPATPPLKNRLKKHVKLAKGKGGKQAARPSKKP